MGLLDRLRGGLAAARALEGEIALQLDTGEVTLRPGDCVVQRGTRHAWRNRSGKPVKMMAVMLSTR